MDVVAIDRADHQGDARRHLVGTPPDTSRVTPRLRIGMVSTYPPTLCGLATFSAALRSALVGHGHRVDVVRVDDAGGATPDGAVRAILAPGSPESMSEAVRVLDAADVAMVQHEFGIYGGPDGDEIVALAGSVSAPLVVVLHTVPAQPSAHQAQILAGLTRLARWTVVMSGAARDRLVGLHPDIDRDRLVTIPHGAAVPEWRGVLETASPTARGLLTWGLIGPGKGIEHVIDAVALLRADGLDVPYTVAGVTHPKVLARDGESYRDGLRARARARGVSDLVTFDSSYRTPEEMTDFVASAGVVVLPYDSREQVTSGVLVDSIAAGRPVVATAFPHAVEMLSDGAGVIVPHASPRHLAAAVRAVIADPSALGSMARRSRQIAPSLSWSAVAQSYAALCAPAPGREAGTAA